MRLHAILIAVLLFLPSCTTKPSEAEGRAALSSFLSQRYGSTPLTVVRFQKTNGQDANVGGIRSYLMYYTASIDFPSGYRTNCILEDGSFPSFDCNLQSAGGAPPPVRAGARVDLQGTISFQEAEQGWLVREVTARLTTTGSAAALQSGGVSARPGPAQSPTIPRPTLTPVAGASTEDCYISLNSNGRPIVGDSVNEGWRFGVNGTVITFNQRDSEYDSRSGAYTARSTDHTVSVRILPGPNSHPEAVNLRVQANGTDRSFRAFRFCPFAD
jgi:hypothetical protein